MRQPKCKMCGAEIIETLVEASPANDWLCLQCSGATIEDFMEDGMTEEDYAEERAHILHQFHGKD